MIVSIFPIAMPVQELRLADLLTQKCGPQGMKERQGRFCGDLLLGFEFRV